MDIAFRTNRLETTFNEERELVRAYGARMARVIQRRVATLGEARSLSEVPTTSPNRRHQLQGDRRDQYAVDLVHPYPLIFEPNHSPVPRRTDGGIDTDLITAITIVAVIDYHCAGVYGMTTSKNQYNPDYRIPPGWILEEHLEARGISPEEFAQQCGRSPQFIHEIIAGEARLDEVTALSFENLLGLAAHIWLGIEDKYQNHRAKQAVDAKIMRSAG